MKEFAPLTCRRCWYTTVLGYSYEREVRKVLIESGWRVEKRLRTSVCPRCLFCEAYRNGQIQEITENHFLCKTMPFKYAYIPGAGDVLQRVENSAREVWIFLNDHEAFEFSLKFRTQ